MSTDANARCGTRIEFMPVLPPEPEFVRLMKQLNSLPLLGYEFPSTPQGKESYFYQLWMEGEPKFEVIHVGAHEP